MEETSARSLYAVHVQTGSEDLIRRLIGVLIDDLGPDSTFIPERIYYFRAAHKWHKLTRELFPGYIFIRTDDAERLFFYLKKVPEFTNLLHDGDYTFVEISGQDRAFIELLCSLSISELRPARGEATRFILPGSRVEIIPEEDIQPGDIIMPKSKGEVVRVLDGPLMKLSTYVSSIDFKSRTAILDKDICKAHKIHLGIRLPKDNFK